MTGEFINHYTILEKLGEGGMGVVYRAHDIGLNRTVALKFLPSHIGTDETDKKRFTNKARAASTLDHSNICTIHWRGLKIFALSAGGRYGI
jgi:eukaryotic-like serine/threonine-protein kinase